MIFIALAFLVMLALVVGAMALATNAASINQTLWHDPYESGVHTQPGQKI